MGLRKHVLDFLVMKALQRRPVIVCATARAPGHALMIDNLFRPLFAFFNAVDMPTGFFAVEPDFAANDTPVPALVAKIARAAAKRNRLVQT